jgi:hypothetical protein
MVTQYGTLRDDHCVTLNGRLSVCSLDTYKAAVFGSLSILALILVVLGIQNRSKNIEVQKQGE